MAEEKNDIEKETAQDDKITPWYLLTLLKPIIADELLATFRFDTRGLRLTFPNGQRFRIRIEELNLIR